MILRVLTLCLLAATVAGGGCVSTTQKFLHERAALEAKESFRAQLPNKDVEFEPPSFPKIESATLPSGLTILVVESRSLPILEMELVFKNGSSQDPQGLAGLMRLTTKMLKEGTKSKTSLELAEGFANLGTELNISASRDFSSLSASVLSSHSEEVLKLFSDIIVHPRFAEDDFARIKLEHQNVLAASRGSPSYLAQLNFFKAAYGPHHPYAHPVDGTKDSINRITLSDIKKTYHSLFGAKNAALIAVGDISLKEVVAIAKKHFGTINPAPISLRKIGPPEHHPHMNINLVPRANSPQTYLLLGRALVTERDPDLASLEVLRSVLSGLPMSRLDRILREEKGWTYGVATNINPLLGKGPMLISTSIQVPYGAYALQEILQQIDKISAEPISDEEFTTAKSGLLHSYASRYDTIDDITSIVAGGFVYSLPLHHEQALYQQVQAVTKTSILDAAKRAFVRDQMTAVAVGDPETMQVPLQQMNLGSVKIDAE